MTLAIIAGAVLLLAALIYWAFNRGFFCRIAAGLVDDWKQAWRWFSMQSMALTVAVLGAWAALPDDMKQAIPSWLVAAVSITLLVAGIAGRLLRQGDGK